MDVTQYISELLFKYNCVILPGFGALVANYQPATIHPSQHLFQPPSKKLAFNRSLKTNDGLLIKRVSEDNAITYEQAEDQVKLFVQKIENSLATKGSFKLEGIGQLFFDIEKNLLFKQEEGSNFLLSSYGLDHFISEPVLRPENMLNIQHQLPNKKTVRKKRSGVWILWLILLLLFSMAVIQFLSWEGLLPEIDLKKIGLNNLPAFNSIKTEMSRKDTVVHIIVFQNPPVQKTKTDTVFVEKINSKTVVSQVSSAANFFVVLGCYKDSLSSVPFTQLCISKQIDVKHIVTSKKYYRIGIGGFETKDAAIEKMMQLCESTGFEAWVMKAD